VNKRHLLTVVLLGIPILYLSFPFVALALSERFAYAWEGEYWAANALKLCSTSEPGQERLVCFCSVVKVHLRAPAEGIAVPDLPLLPLIRNGEAHCDQMAWVLGMLSTRSGYKSQLIHWPGRTHTAIEVDAGDGFHLIDPFTGYHCGEINPYPLSANHIRMADDALLSEWRWDNHPYPGLTVLDLQPEYESISVYSIRWYWMHRLWSWLPETYHQLWRTAFHNRFGFA